MAYLKHGVGRELLLLPGNARPIVFQPDRTEQMRINADGTVGIGTTTPSTALDVYGVITATGGNSTNWNTAFGWGNHALEGYLDGIGDTIDSATQDLYFLREHQEYSPKTMPISSGMMRIRDWG